MDSNNSLTDRIRGWFERSPKAQRAYQRLSTDLDAVVERVDSATSGLRERITPIIDPSREPAAQDKQDAALADETPPELTAQDEQAAVLADQTPPETAAEDQQDAVLADETASDTERGKPRQGEPGR